MVWLVSKVVWLGIFKWSSLMTDGREVHGIIFLKTPWFWALHHRCGGGELSVLLFFSLMKEDREAYELFSERAIVQYINFKLNVMLARWRG